MFDDSGSSVSLDEFENKSKSNKTTSTRSGDKVPDQSFEDEPKSPGRGKSPSMPSPTGGKPTTTGEDKESLSDNFENEPKSSSIESDPPAASVRNVAASSKDWDLRNQWENKKW